MTTRRSVLLSLAALSAGGEVGQHRWEVPHGQIGGLGTQQPTWVPRGQGHHPQRHPGACVSSHEDRPGMSSDAVASAMVRMKVD